MKTKGFLKGTETDDREMIESIRKLRNRLVTEYSEDEIRGVPQLVWKTRDACQCLIRRIIDAADSVRISWNTNNMLAAVTMARSLYETAAVISQLRDAFKAAVETKTPDVLDKGVMKVMFSARHKFFAQREGAEKADSITKVIDLLEDRIFGENLGRLRDSYGFLSEAVHPNHLGTLALYADHSSVAQIIRYGVTKEKRGLIFSEIHFALQLIRVADVIIEEIESMIPEVVKFASE